MRRLFVPAVLCLSLLAAGSGFAADAIPDRNVNMVSGTSWPGGDPFLQRQNEPSIAVSTRNPLHLLAGANDYRTVDLPGLENIKVIGDAWHGVFRSNDGGSTWTSTLHPGYPQDTSPEGMASPLKGYVAGADPVVRAGTNGLFYYFGIVLNRDENPLGALFVSRYLDFNDKESSKLVMEGAHSTRFIDTKIIQKGTAGQFNDKEWAAVDIPRAGSVPCNVAGQVIDGGNVYVAWTILVGGDENVRSKMMVARSTDCGETWTQQKLSESHAINQGSSVTIAPLSGHVYVVWRRITNGLESDALLFSKSTDFGATFSKPAVIRDITPFEQGTTSISFRTTAFPSVAVDGNGRIYVAWSERTANGDGRVALISSSDGVSWSAPSFIDDHLDRGHQFMPTLGFAHGKLTMGWYDQRQDHTTGIYEAIKVGGKNTGQYSETRRPEGHLAVGQPQQVFLTYLQEYGLSAPLLRRHTLDVYVAEALPGVMPAFQTARASSYYFGSRPAPDVAGEYTIEQMQFNPANLPLFRLGTVPFIGDYLDIAFADAMKKNDSGWSMNIEPVKAPVRHIVWTDNRDVRPPLDGNWRNYTPVSASSTSVFDGTTPTPPCVAGQTGMRNQNIYTTRITNGLFAGSPGNTKPFRTPAGEPLQRAFVVFVQNTLKEPVPYRLTIVNQPVGGKASFHQLPEPGFPDPLTTLDVVVPARSAIARSVFATSSQKYDDIQVHVQQITAPSGVVVPDGLETIVVLNPDIANPDIANPDIANPDIANPDIANAEVYNPDIANPDIANPDIANPDIANPDIANPDIANPDIANPDIANPDIANPDIANPDIANPDIANPDIANGSVTDTTWETTNEGNTTASYSVNLLLNGQVPDGFKTQLILHRIYTTPVAKGCTLDAERHTVLFANINSPEFTDPEDLATSDVTDPSEKNATMWLLPGETMRVTLRVVDPDRSDAITFDAANQVIPVTIAHSINTENLDDPDPRPSMSLVIITMRLHDAITGTAYMEELTAVGGKGTRHWNAEGLPPGLTVNDGGTAEGTPTFSGDYYFSATVSDSAEHEDEALIYLRVVEPLTIPEQTLAPATIGEAYSATLVSSGGVAPFTWSVVSGSLPAGLSLSSSGVISGTPTAVQLSTFTVRAEDGTYPSPQAATRELTLQVGGTLFLTFLTQPVSGFPATPQVDIDIRAQDEAGAVLPGVSVTLALGENPCDASMAPRTALTDETGVARFAGLPSLPACDGYTYRASAEAVGYTGGSVDSDPFDIYGFTTLLTGLEYPRGLAIRSEKVYLTETAGRNTTFGGRIRLLEYDVPTSGLTVLIDNPTNSDSVVALTNTQLYLGSYIDSTPGSSGAISSALYDADAGMWTETPVTSVAIAVTDMYLDAIADIYVIGSSDNTDAASLYRLPAGSYAEGGVVLRHGLGRAQSMTRVGSTTYYSRFLPGEVRRFAGEIDEVFISEANVVSMTSDGTYLYYAEMSPNAIRRKHIATGAVETIETGEVRYNAVRFDPAAGKLYVLEAGTDAAQFKDGKLKVLSSGL